MTRHTHLRAAADLARAVAARADGIAALPDLDLSEVDRLDRQLDEARYHLVAAALASAFAPEVQ